MSQPAATLYDLLPSPTIATSDAGPDAILTALTTWTNRRDLQFYPHQEESILHLLSGANVVLSTPTGSGKSLVAVAAHAWALARNEVSFYTAPIKALVNEKFFDLVEIFGAENVGMLTGDASVNPTAPIICCTAEILAQIALSEGPEADVSVVIMDEFHYYADPQRGWAWQVPLLQLPQAQFLLMSATLGDTSNITTDLSERTKRATETVDTAERPVPLDFEYSLEPLPETITALLEEKKSPIYVVFFTQASAVEQAQRLLSLKILSAEERKHLGEKLRSHRFAPGFGHTLKRLLAHGIGVHHAGMLPTYRRLVENLAQLGLLKVICGTDTLGVGINVPIRTVLLSSLTKYDGVKQRQLKAREFHQIAGRAGRAGYDTSGSVVVQAPEHVIENHRIQARAALAAASKGGSEYGRDKKGRKKHAKANLRKAPEGFVHYNEETFTKLIDAPPEPLSSRMRITHGMLLGLIARPGDAFTNVAQLLRSNHEPRKKRNRLARTAIAQTRELLRSGIITYADTAETGFASRTVELAETLQDHFTLNQPLAPFAIAAVESLDADSPDYVLDVLAVVEAILESPRPVLYAQQRAMRHLAIAEMKADGLDYEERTERLETITWPQPFAEELASMLESYREHAPWLHIDDLQPKAVVREMFTSGWGFADLVRAYELARSEGVLLRYLSDVYRTLQHTVPESAKTFEVETAIDWLGEVIRQTDSSILDEWEALAHPEKAAAGGESSSAAKSVEAPRKRLLVDSPHVVRVAIRNLMFSRVQMAARDDVPGLAAAETAVAASTTPATEIVMDFAAWDGDLEAYYQVHDEILVDADARNPQLLHIVENPETWQIRQTILDPAGDKDWGIDAQMSVAASNDLGSPVVVILGLNRMDGFAE